MPSKVNSGRRKLARYELLADFEHGNDLHCFDPSAWEEKLGKPYWEATWDFVELGYLRLQGNYLQRFLAHFRKNSPNNRFIVTAQGAKKLNELKNYRLQLLHRYLTETQGTHNHTPRLQYEILSQRTVQTQNTSFVESRGRQELTTSIAARVQDYRRGEIAPITPERVDQWVCQFDSCDQLPILTEIDRLLARFYWSRSRVKNEIRAFLTYDPLFRDNPRQRLSKVSFLDTQARGKSQKELLAITNEVLQENFDLDLAHCKGTTTYIYIDDALFTGGTVSKTILKPQNQPVPQGATVIFFHFCCYDRREWVRGKIEENLSVKTRFVQTEFLNSSRRKGSVDFFWPKRIPLDDIATSYCSNLETALEIKLGSSSSLFRNLSTGIQDPLFSSEDHRNILERAFLIAGIKRITSVRNPKERLYPLGQDNFISLGFGAFFVTYRNVANNCPLALWYGAKGDGSVSDNSPLKLWLPLFPRKG
jgi:hypothetical protein